MDNTELHEQLVALLGVDIPEGTLRRWVHDGIIPRPTSVYKGKGGGSGRFSDWPPETVEQAVAIYVLRHDNTDWAKPTNKAIIATKKAVERWYNMIDEFKRTGDGTVLQRFALYLESPKKQNNKHSEMPTEYSIIPLFSKWITTLEKIRHKEPLFEPKKVTFHIYSDISSGVILRTQFKGVTLEPSSIDGITLNHVKTETFKRTTAAAVLANNTYEGQIDFQEVFIDLSEFGNIEYDIENQRIIITPSEKGRKLKLDLKGSGMRLVKDDDGA